MTAPRYHRDLPTGASAALWRRHRGSVIGRTVAAFAAAPPVGLFAPALALAVLDGMPAGGILGVGLAGLAVAYLYALLFCLPIHWVLLRLGRIGWRVYVAAGAAITAVLPLIFLLFELALWRGEAVETALGVLGVALAMGALAGAVFWLVAFWRNPYYFPPREAVVAHMGERFG